jgi:hypothetical protein
MLSVHRINIVGQYLEHDSPHIGDIPKRESRTTVVSCLKEITYPRVEDK